MESHFFLTSKRHKNWFEIPGVQEIRDRVLHDWGDGSWLWFKLSGDFKKNDDLRNLDFHCTCAWACNVTIFPNTDRAVLWEFNFTHPPVIHPSVNPLLVWGNVHLRGCIWYFCASEPFISLSIVQLYIFMSKTDFGRLRKSHSVAKIPGHSESHAVIQKRYCACVNRF